MKQGSFRVLCVMVMAAVGLPLMADDRTIDFEAKVIESFNGDSGNEWMVAGSKFATKDEESSFPRMNYVAAWPQALFGSSPQDPQKSLGIWGRFDRRGYNWVDVYPVKAAEGGAEGETEATELPLPGRVQYLDMWVWGSNLDYYIEAYVRDYEGVVHVIPMGSIKYEGWRDLRARVPNTVPQGKRILPRKADLSFVKFRVWTQPKEVVDNFYVYFDQFKVLTDQFETFFDGDALARPETIQELWNGNAQGAAQ